MAANAVGNTPKTSDGLIISSSVTHELRDLVGPPTAILQGLGEPTLRKGIGALLEKPDHEPNIQLLGGLAQEKPNRATTMSVLFRTREWLTLDQLAHAWTRELPGAEKDPSRFERDLVHLLLEDIANGRLDDAGPLVEGRRLGLRLIDPDFRPRFLEGQQILDALRSGATGELFGPLIVIMKEALLAFALMHELPAPSWWRDTPIDAPLADDPAAVPPNSVLIPKHGRRSIKLERVKQAMREDIQQDRLTSLKLETMLEKEIEARYSVSRETARKARKAVLSETRRSTKSTNDN
jgi:hypothetical protein